MNLKLPDTVSKFAMGDIVTVAVSSDYYEVDDSQMIITEVSWSVSHSEYTYTTHDYPLVTVGGYDMWKDCDLTLIRHTLGDPSHD